MALFQGEDLIDIQHPDGRVLTLPRSLVPPSMMPQEQIAQPPTGFADEPLSTGPAEQPPGPPSWQLPQAPEQGPFPAQTTPDYAAGTVDNTAPAIAQGNAAFDKQQKHIQQQQAQAASPRGRETQADTDVQKAFAQKIALGQAESEVNTTANALQAASKQTRDQEIADWQAKQDKAAADYQQNLATKQGQADSLKTKIANTKIDRTADHPLMAAIAIAVSGLGSAMKKEGTNPALDIFYKALDRKVADQMGNLDQLRSTYNMSREDIGDLRTNFQDANHARDVLKSGILDKAARYADTLAATTTSALTKINAGKQAAQWRQEAAQLSADAAGKEADRDERIKEHRETIGLGYANLNQTAKTEADRMQFEREKLAVDKAAQLAQQRATQGAAADKVQRETEKDNSERGLAAIKNTKAGGNDYLLNADGRAAVSKADKLEAEANQLKLEAQAPGADIAMSFAGGSRAQNANAAADAKLQQAAQLRDYAKTEGVLKERNAVTADKFGQTYEQTQALTDAVDNMKLLYESPTGGKSLLAITKNQAEIQAQSVAILMRMKNIWGLGVLSKQDTNLLVKAGIENPTDGWDTGYLASKVGAAIGKDPEAWRQTLNRLVSDAQDGVVEHINGLRGDYSKEDLFSSKGADENTPEAKASVALREVRTPGEEAADIKSRGTLRRAFDKVVGERSLGDVVTGSNTESPLFPSNAELAKVAETRDASSQYPGFRQSQEGPLSVLLESSRNGDPKAAARASGTLMQMATDPTSPARQIATLNVLREYNHDLYGKARAQLPKDSAILQQVVASEGASQQNKLLTDRATEDTPSGMLYMQAVAGSDSARAALARKAGAGDTEAQKYLDKVIANQGRQAGQ